MEDFWNSSHDGVMKKSVKLDVDGVDQDIDQ